MTGLWVLWHPRRGMLARSGAYQGPAPTEDDVPPVEIGKSGKWDFAFVGACWQVAFLGEDGRFWPIRSQPSLRDAIGPVEGGQAKKEGT